MASDTYQELSRDEAVQIVDGAIHHAAHVMLYARVDEKLFDCYDVKYAILVSYTGRSSNAGQLLREIIWLSVIV